MTTRYDIASNAHLFVVAQDVSGKGYGLHYEIRNPIICLESSDQSLAHLNVDGYVVNREITSLDILDKMLDK